MIPDPRKKIVAIFILVCFIAYIYLFRHSYPYSKRLDTIAVNRLRDTPMTYGLSHKELTENFSTNNSVTVTPSEAIYRRLSLVYERPCHFARTLTQVIPRVYPFETIAIRSDAMSVLEYMETRENTIGIVSDEAYRAYLAANHHPPKSVSRVHHILSFGAETPTLLLPPSFRIPGMSVEKSASKMYSQYKPDWYDLKFADRPFRIGTTDVLTTSHQTLRKIIDGLLNYTTGTAQKSLPAKPEIVIVKNDIDEIRSAFTEGRIDGYFIVVSHPNPIVQELVVQESYQLMGLGGIDPNTYMMLFPSSEPTILNTAYYGTYASVGLKSMQQTIHIVANSRLSRDVVRRFCDSIFRNFVGMKAGMGIQDVIDDSVPRLRVEVPREAQVSFRQIEFRAQMSAFSPDYLYPRYMEFPLHGGADVYFREIGVITNQPNPECGYTVGISKCDKVPYINPYRLMI